jgi:hypothetical protein
MAGRLNHVSYMLPQLRCYLNSLYRMLCGWGHLKATRPIPEDVADNMRYWHTTLLTLQETRLIPNPAPTEIGWVGDASTKYGIGVLIGQHWAQFQLRELWPKKPKGEGGIAWLETVAIRLGLLMLESLGIRPGKTFIVWANNTTTQSLIRKRKLGDRAVNEEWKIIQTLMVRLQTKIVAKRVTSANNNANALSQGEVGDLEARRKVVIKMPFDLNRYLRQM